MWVAEMVKLVFLVVDGKLQGNTHVNYFKWSTKKLRWLKIYLD